jgi:hypothetical protein
MVHLNLAHLSLCAISQFYFSKCEGNGQPLSQNGDYQWPHSLTSKWGLPMTAFSHLKKGLPMAALSHLKMMLPISYPRVRHRYRIIITHPKLSVTINFISNFNSTNWTLNPKPTLNPKSISFPEITVWMEQSDHGMGSKIQFHQALLKFWVLN